MMRPRTSVPPPGANPTTMVTGRFGQLWAATGSTAAQTKAVATKANAIIGLASMVGLVRSPGSCFLGSE
jgi:hypothetical protein